MITNISFSWALLISRGIDLEVKYARSHFITEHVIVPIPIPIYHVSVCLSKAVQIHTTKFQRLYILSPTPSPVTFPREKRHYLHPLFDDTIYTVPILPFSLNRITLRWLHISTMSHFFPKG